jgi:hypothetical protein
MTLFVNILVVISAYLPNNGNANFKGKYINPDFFFYEILFDSTAEIINENKISNHNTEQEKNHDLTLFYRYKNGKLSNKNTITSFLSGLLPFLIDQPPPLLFGTIILKT